MPMQLSSLHQHRLGTASVLLLLLLLVATITWLSMQKGLAELAETKAQMLAQRETLQQLTKLQQQIHATEQSLHQSATVVAVVPILTNPNDIIELISTEAEKSKIYISRLRPGDRNQQAQKSFLPFALACSGPFPDLYRFLQQVQHRLPMLEVTKLQIEASEHQQLCRMEALLQQVIPCPLSTEPPQR